MPGKDKCSKIQDPKEKSDCLNYKGKYSKDMKGNMSKNMGKMKKDMGSMGGY